MPRKYPQLRVCTSIVQRNRRRNTPKINRKSGRTYENIQGLSQSHRLRSVCPETGRKWGTLRIPRLNPYRIFSVGLPPQKNVPLPSVPRFVSKQYDFRRASAKKYYRSHVRPDVYRYPFVLRLCNPPKNYLFRFLPEVSPLPICVPLGFRQNMLVMPFVLRFRFLLFCLHLHFPPYIAMNFALIL